MKTKHIFAVLATASLLAGGQALAQGRGGGQGGGHGQGHGAGGMGHGAGGIRMDTRGNVGVGVDRGSVNSNADVRTRGGIDRGPNSITTGTRIGNDVRTRSRDRSDRLSDDRRGGSRTVDTSVLADLDTGMEVRTSDGTLLGEIVRINHSANGIVNVLVRADGHPPRTIPLHPGTITIDGDIVTTAGVLAPSHPTANLETGIDARTDARLNSRGPERANARARARANENSVLATDRVVPDLSALATGLVVRDSAGVDVGTVVRINRSSDGRISNVLIRGEDGRTFPLAPNSLTISGDIVTATDLTLDVDDDD